MRIMLGILLSFFVISTTWAKPTAQPATSPASAVHFENERVVSWRVDITPGEPLKMREHKYDHIVVALADGQLKIVQEDGSSHIITMKKYQSYWFPKDLPGKKHGDVLVGKKPLPVIVIRLKQDPQVK